MKFQDPRITLELPDVLTYLKVDPEKKSFLNEAQKALEMAYSLMKPKILYQKGAIRKSSSPTLFINNVEFRNKALFYNLSDTDECFLYIMTIGKEYRGV